MDTIDPERSDGDLVRAFLQGETRAFDVLYQRHINHLRWRFARLDSDSEDIIQQAFLHAIPRLWQIRNAEQFFPWLYRIAYHIVIDTRTKKQRMNRISFNDDDGAHNPHLTNVVIESVITTDNRHVIRRAVARLQPMYRDVIEMIYYRGLSLLQVATELGKSYSKSTEIKKMYQLAAQRHSRALRQLSAMLAPILCTPH